MQEPLERPLPELLHQGGDPETGAARIAAPSGVDRHRQLIQDDHHRLVVLGVALMALDRLGHGGGEGMLDFGPGDREVGERDLDEPDPECLRIIDRERLPVGQREGREAQRHQPEMRPLREDVGAFESEWTVDPRPSGPERLHQAFELVDRHPRGDADRSDLMLMQARRQRP